MEAITGKLPCFASNQKQLAENRIPKWQYCPIQCSATQAIPPRAPEINAIGLNCVMSKLLTRGYLSESE